MQDFKPDPWGSAPHDPPKPDPWASTPTDNGFDSNSSGGWNNSQSRGDVSKLRMALPISIAGFVLAMIGSIFVGIQMGLMEFGGGLGFGIVGIILGVIAVGLGAPGIILAAKNVRAKLGMGIPAIILGGLAVSNGAFVLLLGCIFMMF